jgi:hypothetical protein
MNQMERQEEEISDSVTQQGSDNMADLGTVNQEEYR